MVVRGCMLRRRRRGCTVRDSCCWGTHRVRRVRDCDEAHHLLDCCVVEVHWLHCEELQLLVERIVSDAFAMITMLIRL